MVGFNSFDVEKDVKGNYKSADLFIVPKGKLYVDLVEEILDVFEEEKLELKIDESSMPLPYYQAMEIPLEVFEEKYGIEDEKHINRKKVLELCEELFSLGFFDIGFKGKNVSFFVDHNGFINVKPEKIEKKDFQDKIEGLGEKDD